MHGHALFEGGYCIYHHFKNKCKSVPVHSMKGTVELHPSSYRHPVNGGC